ncbi:BolA/IbaG family iron-sulfur metabolism protein [Xylophilus rhododendri]|uniref:BolA/IbaG family iron-sulfur metabolism protein n=1 Tax=Xylophilus rhododendri TaxID=2697032 RepID=A0A857JDC7_9BURK|nr:BolA family protein [Xylophilus rhododendri]QHJ01214.1 BolA/IbaG family iron-sulfur metabolism protein [Xylophilus rhododendri]
MTAMIQPQDITADALVAQLQRSLQPTRLEVIDESAAHAGHVGANGSGFGTHFRVRIASLALAGRTRVAQHRLVYDALRPFLDAGLHALAIEVLPEPSTPAAV